MGGGDTYQIDNVTIAGDQSLAGAVETATSTDTVSEDTDTAGGFNPELSASYVSAHFNQMVAAPMMGLQSPWSNKNIPQGNLS
jgi:hypothetical protein